MNRKQYAVLIEARLRQELERMRDEFPAHTVQSCYIDNLLPESEALKIFEAFPDKSTMMLKKSLRENKYVAAQMNKYPPILEEIIYAFQEPNVVQVVTEITGIQEMVPDTHLYAGGISLMAKDNCLNPHLDNSHDKDRERYRVLNLLYYVTPDWSHEAGGNLELWDDGPKEKQREITSHFNRLALMATHAAARNSQGLQEGNCRESACLSQSGIEPFE
jgi:Rps23 Pro-64 3,4-dihydroxylase Tpa1-like proline 4-hydroxylase